MNNKKEKALGFLRCLPIILTLLAIILYFINRKSLTVENLTNLVPENTALAVIFVLMLAALKSVSVFFPFLVIELISTFIFPRGIALVVNIAALAVSLVTAYAIGRFSGSGMAERLRKKYPKFNDFQGIIEKNNAFSVFALRIVGILPMDAVSIYLGAMKTNFMTYIIASIIGGLPDLILETFIGEYLGRTSSPLFYAAIAVRLFLTMLSIFIYRIVIRKKNRRLVKTENNSGNDKA